MTELASIHGLAANRALWRHVIGVLPVGAVWGERDHVIPRSGLDVFRECRPEAPVEVIEDAGHIPMIERPRAFADALIRVVQRA